MQNVSPTAHVLAELRTDLKPVLLHITHHWGGGTEQHVQEITDYLGDAAAHIVLRSRADGFVILSVPGKPDQTYHPQDDFPRLIKELRTQGVTRVHVHQLFTVPVEVGRLIDELDVAFDFSVHDYHTLCPRVHFKTRDSAYCQEPDAAGCTACLHDWPLADERDINAYRARYAWVYQHARRIICPSRDVAGRIERYCPEAKLVVAPHPRPVSESPSVNASRIAAPEPLRIAVLGWVTAFKGAARVLGSARLAAAKDLPLRFQVIGTIDGEAPPGLDVTGPYQAKDLQHLLIEYRPHILWYAAQVPETYSYILTEGLEAGLPVVVPRLGAFPERVSGRPWSWIVDWNSDSGAGRHHVDDHPRALCFRRASDAADSRRHNGCAVGNGRLLPQRLSGPRAVTGFPFLEPALPENSQCSGGPVLFVFPHPDDDVFVGGTLSLLVRAGVVVDAAWMTSGGYDDLDRVREDELRRAMDIAGVERRHLLRLPDGRLVRGLDDACTSLAALIGSVKPQAVIGPAFEGGHADHDATSFAVAEACRRAGMNVPIFEYPCYAPDADAPKGLRLSTFPTHSAGVSCVRLNEAATRCKELMVEAYASQKAVFELLGWRLSREEFFRKCPQDRDHRRPPCAGLDSYAHWFNWRSADRFNHLAAAVVSSTRTE